MADPTNDIGAAYDKMYRAIGNLHMGRWVYELALEMTDHDMKGKPAQMKRDLIALGAEKLAVAAGELQEAASGYAKLLRAAGKR